MKQTHQNCLVCKSNSITPFINCKDYFVSGETFELYHCKDCGFIFTQHIPTASEIGPYYQSETYISHSNSRQGITNKLYHTVRNIMLHRKYRLIKKYTDGKELLDIGCGTGHFANYMHKMGYHSKGLEPDANARKFAREQFHLPVEEPEKVLAEDHTDQYNVITLWHVLEHLHDPARYLAWIHCALKNEGVLVIALPNCSSLDAQFFKAYWAAYDVPRHIWHFTPKTFTAFALKSGFSVQQIKRLPFDAYYNSLLSLRYKKSRLALPLGFLIGFVSNLKSLICPKTASSVIYVLRKQAY
ncbi:MAG: class I SAM-dependent methyltransferase [Bacteroidota bacterium]|nr:MAG: class I SAM-dependent methyltransferase [Bacteroidota bacterium]